MSRKASNNRGGDSRVWIYGKHSAIAAINNPAREIARIVATRNTAQELGLSGNVEITDDAKIAALVGRDAVHQGVAVHVSSLEEKDLAEIELGNLIILLDQITDPHNVGAILRSSSAFGASAVVTTERNSPAQTGVLAKAASGALEYVDYIRVGNLAEAITYLKKQGFWIAGMDGQALNSITEIKGYEKIAIVMGAEGSGLRHKTREYCDFLVKIPMNQRQESLNVSNAAAIALWEAAKRTN